MRRIDFLIGPELDTVKLIIIKEGKAGHACNALKVLCQGIAQACAKGYLRPVVEVVYSPKAQISK